MGQKKAEVYELGNTLSKRIDHIGATVHKNVKPQIEKNLIKASGQIFILELPLGSSSS